MANTRNSDQHAPPKAPTPPHQSCSAPPTRTPCRWLECRPWRRRRHHTCTKLRHTTGKNGNMVDEPMQTMRQNDRRISVGTRSASRGTPLWISRSYWRKAGCGGTDMVTRLPGYPTEGGVTFSSSDPAHLPLRSREESPGRARRTQWASARFGHGRWARLLLVQTVSGGSRKCGETGCAFSLLRCARSWRVYYGSSR